MRSTTLLAAAATSAIALVAGCSGQDASAPAPGSPGNAPVPAVKDAAKDLKQIGKDVTPPVIVGPGQPGKAG